MVDFDKMKKKAKDAVDSFSDDDKKNDRTANQMKTPQQSHEDRKNSENTMP